MIKKKHSVAYKIKFSEIKMISQLEIIYEVFLLDFWCNKKIGPILAAQFN